ncbi:CD1247 N-terminal domain-containing protein [Clostridium sp. JN-1]|uniref:CD1247 N-terminal domain-containing protein n=1 Tax=Clostridium sp. JN-1 TaxID=2483110 RepID=UPI000F0B349F|nr:CD1247 N-terminal domain-containing protein [Clostridium sp. JN-1]
MSSILSKVSYVNGLMDGLDIDKNTKEGKILVEVVNVLKAMAEEIEDISESQKSIGEYMDVVDENLNDLQDDLYYDDYQLYEDEGDNFIQFKCSNCGDDIYIDKDIIGQREEITCPNCHNKMPLDVDLGKCEK